MNYCSYTVDWAAETSSAGNPRRPRGTPVAIRTRLGWIAFATLSSDDGADVYVRRIEAEHSTKAGSNRDFQWELEQWSNMETVPTPKKRAEIRSSEDVKALDVLHSTTKRLPSGDAFESGILWRDPNVVLPNNHKAAEAQLHALEHRLECDPELKEAYRKSIINDVEKGYIKKLSKQEVQETASDRVNYLTHHPVRNPKKPGKVRRVYNVAAKQGRTALCSDIKDMFLQMRVVEEDLPALRFLYRDSKEEPNVYQCLRRPFGERSAPTCANYIMKQNADNYQQQYPATAEAVRKNMYVDNSLNSLDDEEKAVTLRLTELMKHGGFALTKWWSNIQAVMRDIPEADKVQTNEVGLRELPVSQALGVRFNAHTDTLHLSAPKKTPSHAKTPRELLSRIASIWDPHGWLSLYTIRGRMLQQQLCLEELGWDKEVPEDQLRE
ncbi:uncharacterized protein LOC114531407 [Dendronephthya gigantea]|uniref:uncharacterized protein LOC114531407 n=1 Tax=Dendronephthya gigantea TaxID=151771 RepID=UPI00106CF300|nr:uncharacterized protein LOC114531407 [Dendronephthya gigantea]